MSAPRCVDSHWQRVPVRYELSGLYGDDMHTAIVFITTQVDKVSEVADRIAAMSEVTEVYSVTGAMDLIAIVRTREVERIADVVTRCINQVPGVTGTETHLAFRAYSTHDLDAAFSLGE